MNNPNLQIPKIIYQTQCTYLFWYVLLNYLAQNDIFLCWDGEQFKLITIEGNELVLEEDAKAEPDNENQWSNGIDLQPLKKDGLDITIQEATPNLKPYDIILRPTTGKFPITIIMLSKEEPPEEDNSDSKKYKSPPHKLIDFFKRSRDKWKSKCIDCKEQLKLAKKNLKNSRSRNEELKDKVKSLESSISKLKSTEERLEQQVQELQKSMTNLLDISQSLNVVPERHQYPIGIIYMYVILVLTASTSLRGASRALEVFVSTLNFDCSIPSWPCGRLWLQQLGYYKLTRPKEKANDWIWIADHFMQLDDKKCFAIYAIRQSKLSKLERALTYEDVEPLAILPVNKSSGTIVLEQLEQTIEQTGVPREIIGDHGSDIKKGIDDFCKNHQETSYIHDIKHKTALILKHEFEQDEDWKEFIKSCSATKSKIQQTSLAFLIPKKQRSKARYMNIDFFIEWGVNILNFVEKATSYKLFDAKEIKKKLCWIHKYKKSLEEWSKIVKMMSTTEQFIRKKGIRFNNYSSLKRKLHSISTSSSKLKRLSKKVLDFIKLESLKVKVREKLLGSSEIIESIFGKFKEVEKGQNGFTGLVLMLAAMVSTTSMDTLREALETVKVKDVIKWCEQNIGESMQSKRKKYFKGSSRKKFPKGYKKKEQKQGKSLLPI